MTPDGGPCARTARRRARFSSEGSESCLQGNELDMSSILRHECLRHASVHGGENSVVTCREVHQVQVGDLFWALQPRKADGRLSRRGVVDKEHVIVKRCQLTESGEHISGRDLESGDSRIHEETQVGGLGDGTGRLLIHTVEPGADHLMVRMVGQ